MKIFSLAIGLLSLSLISCVSIPDEPPAARLIDTSNQPTPVE